MTPSKLFLFDLDGTLVSTGGAGLNALTRAFKTIYSIDQILSTINPSGKTDPAIFREVITTFLSRDVKEGELDQVASVYLKFLAQEMEIASQLRVLPGVEEFLGFLSTRPDVSVGLGTGNLEKGARLKLGPTGLNRYFAFGGFGSDAEDRAVMLRVGHEKAERHHNVRISPSSVYVIGDTPLDIHAARRAGFVAVAVATGHVPAPVLQLDKPDYLMNDLTEGFEFMNKLDAMTSPSR
jgi:phosphoglycolate phosphatase